MKILFWGTPAFAVPSLRALDDEGFDIVGVVTQPDRPAGRGRRLRPSAIKEVALDQGFPILMPELPRGDDFIDQIRALEPDISVVVAYGHILKSGYTKSFTPTWHYKTVTLGQERNIIFFLHYSYN